jgi:enoyl-CoA hydratase/carnithine racemase
MTGITCSVDDGVLTVTIDRPHVRNAMDRAAAEALATALDELDGDPSLSVGILTGANGWFCAGMDLKAFARDGERPLSAGRGAFGIVERPPVKPLIAAVEGSALGGGLEIVLACDLVVASRTAQFGLPEVRRGLVAAAGGLLRLPRRVCRSRALELALLGDPCPAERAAD